MTHTTNEKAPGACNTEGLETDTTNDLNFATGQRPRKELSTLKKQSVEPLTLTTTTDEARVDSRVLARNMGVKSRASFALIERYADTFKSHGQVTFKKAVGERLQGGGNAERYVMLNEDQSFFLLTLSRNTDRVVALKARLVKAFGEARRARDLHRTEYLPGYHELHDALHLLASESDHERQVHMNFNKLVNKAAGIEAGQRAGLNLPKQSMLIVAQMMALQAVRAAPGHKEAYQLSKAAVAPLLALGEVALAEVAAQRLEVAND